MYVILPRTFKKAKENNVIIKASNRAKKKIDIYDKQGYYITSVGNTDYLDYAYYLKFSGKKIADERKRLYELRHKKNIKIKGSAGYYAFIILWS